MEKLKIELLEDSTGYQTWAMKMAAVLKHKGLFSVAVENPAPDVGDATYGDWLKKNDEAFAIVILGLSKSQLGMFIGETKAKDIWDKLKKIPYGCFGRE